MKIVDNIKRNAGIKALNKSLRSFKRNKFVHNLVTARRIAIVGVVNASKDFDDIYSLQRLLTEKNMQVEVLVYFPGKEIPQHFLMRKGITIFSKLEVNWYGKPLVPSVEKFCNVEFDILIDLSLTNEFSTRWISTFSKSKFKVGSHTYEGNPYDLIINVDNKKEIPYLSEQIVYYLNILNNRFAQGSQDMEQ